MTRTGRKALVVDDSPYARRVLKELLEADPLVGEVDVAGNGQIALDKAVRREPDLVLLDLQMPVMDGFTFLRLFRKRSTAPVLVVSALDDAATVDRALDLGANGFIGKPEDAYRELRTISRELRLKVRGLFTTLKPRSSPTEPGGVSPPSRPIQQGFPLVVIGSSSGGPPSLQYLLTSLPPMMEAAVLIAQHLPPGFTQSFAQRLNGLITHPVKEARSGQPLAPGAVVICPGGRNMLVRPGAEGPVLQLEDVEGQLHVPSVDRLFTSAAEVCGARVTGFVLTGMGRDGAEGVKAVKANGGRIYAESEETAAIYGMPREAAATGCVEAILPLPEIALRLIEVSGTGGDGVTPESRARGPAASCPVPCSGPEPEP